MIPKVITGTTLKWVALVTMLIDHIGAVLLESVTNVQVGEAAYDVIQGVDEILRAIGRLSFPLYVFLLAEGFFHTHDRIKYFGRLAAFALISELPFDLCFSYTAARGESLISFGYQNVFFTLLLGFAAMYVMEKIRPDDRDFAGPQTVFFVKLFGCAIVAAIFAIIANLLKTDYAASGVVACACAYAMWFTGSYILMYFALLIPLIFYSPVESFAVFGLVVVAMYNGKRGKSLPSWFFYLTYPVHLLVYGLIRVLGILIWWQ